ncbi:hypothetical protein [Pelagibacterium sediminicola]|uniref:hypothetical protein n=1 Tax=Pelagibacterium sediminicola TaxID=2248761 RepID=UPI001300BBD6|nr:hypothetical protein [Pelagibacterium sediminicola]
MSSLVNSESSGNWNALNEFGYGGSLQFGDARLADAARAGIIPQGLTGAQFSQLSPEQQMAVESWHFEDIDRPAGEMGLDSYIGQNIGGVNITLDAIRAMAHLGGIGGRNGSLRAADSTITPMPTGPASAIAGRGMVSLVALPHPPACSGCAGWRIIRRAHRPSPRGDIQPLGR